MLLFFLAYAAIDGGIVEIFNSPFVVPVAGCLMVLGIVATSIWAKVRSQEIRSRERLTRIAHGLPVGPDWEETTVRSAIEATPASTSRPTFQVSDGGKARRAGIVLCSIGLGLFAFFAALAAIVQVREVLAGGAAGIIPLALGIGFLVDSQIKKREYERRLAAGNGAVLLASDLPGGAPAPAIGMTPAQASDWRPLH